MLRTNVGGNGRLGEQLRDDFGRENYQLVTCGVTLSFGGDNTLGTVCSHVVVTSGWVYYWYNGQDMGFPMAIISVVGLLSSGACYSLTPIVYNYKGGLALPFWLSFILCILGLTAALVIIAVTRYAERENLISVCPCLTLAPRVGGTCATQRHLRQGQLP